MSVLVFWCWQYISRIGSVHRITDRGDVRVQYSNNIRWTFHPGALTKASPSLTETQRLLFVQQAIFTVSCIYLVPLKLICRLSLS